MYPIIISDNEEYKEVDIVSKLMMFFSQTDETNSPAMCQQWFLQRALSHLHLFWRRLFRVGAAI